MLEFCKSCKGLSFYVRKDCLSCPYDAEDIYTEPFSEKEANERMTRIAQYVEPRLQLHDLALPKEEDKLPF